MLCPSDRRRRGKRADGQISTWRSLSLSLSLSLSISLSRSFVWRTINTAGFIVSHTDCYPALTERTRSSMVRFLLSTPPMPEGRHTLARIGKG